MLSSRISRLLIVVSQDTSIKHNLVLHSVYLSTGTLLCPSRNDKELPSEEDADSDAHSQKSALMLSVRAYVTRAMS